MKHEVRTRYGWGWEVVGPDFCSWPIETAIAAEKMADAMNAGQPPHIAVEIAGLRMSGARLVDRT